MATDRRGRERLHHNLKHVVAEAGQQNSLPAMLGMLTESIRSIFQSDAVMLYLLSQADGLLHPHLAATDREDDLPSLPPALVARRILGAPYRWPSDDRDPETEHCALFASMTERGFSTWFSLPLQTGEGAVGLIAVGYHRYEFLVDGVSQILWEFANDVAQALVRLMGGDVRQPGPTGGPADLPAVDVQTQERLRRLLSSHYQLTHALWAGDELDAMVQSLADLLKNPVAVLDRYLSPIAQHPAGAAWQEELDFVRRWIAQSGLGAAFLPVRITDASGRTFVVAPIQMGDRSLGCLVVTERQSRLDDLDVIAAQQATMVLAVQFYKSGLRIERQGNSFHELFNMLLDQPARWGALRSEEAQAIGWDPDAEQSIAVATWGGATDLGMRLERIRMRLAGDLPQIFVARRQGTLAFLIPGAEVRPQLMARLAEGIRESVRELRPESSLGEAAASAAKPPVFLGLSRPTRSAAQLGQAYTDALMASRLLPLVDPGADYLAAESIEVQLLLAPLRRSEAARSFGERTLGALARYDERHQTELTRTLQCFLEHNGNLTETAAALFIHRTSLQYRLGRIEAFLGQPLDAASVRFKVQLALALRTLMRIADEEKPGNGASR